MERRKRSVELFQRRFLIIVAVIILALQDDLNMKTLSLAASFTNPVYSENFPDPFILLEGTTYYAFSTNNGPYNIPTLSSADGSFTNWQFVGDALPTLPPWAEANAGLTWAPAILPLQSAGSNETTYIMYYTARQTASGLQCVSYAISKGSITGPYTDPNLSQPFVCQSPIGGSIDANPFVDLNGDLYLIWKNDGNCCGYQVNIWAQQLTAEGTAFAPQTTPIALITNDLPWEGNLVEGPSMIVRFSASANANVYYLFYSANNYESYQYAVGYATCTSPIGSCEKGSYSPIISYYGAVWGPGGETPFLDPHGDLWFCYHGWTAPNATYPSGARSLRIDRLNFINDKPILADHVPTTSPVYYSP